MTKHRGIYFSAVVALCLLAWARPAFSAPLKKGDAAPGFRLVPLADSAGPEVTLAKLARAKKPVVLSFFATWCAPCLREIPVLEAVRKSGEADVYMVSVDSAPPETVRAFMKERGFTLPVLLDPEGVRAGVRYDVVSGNGQVRIPQTYVLSPDMTVWWRHEGASESLESELRGQIKELQADLAANNATKAVTNDPNSVWLVFTNSANGLLGNCGCSEQPFGGVTRRATFFKQVRKSSRADGVPALFFDTGDNIDPHRTSLETWAKAFGRLGYDAAVLGDQEVVLGAGRTRKILLPQGHPFLGINYAVCDDETCEVLPAYKVFTEGNVKVGVIGAIDPDVFALIPKGWEKWLKTSDPRKKLAETAAKVRQEADVVVLLSHGGYDSDRLIAEQVPGIDLIIGGHSQTFMKTPTKIVSPTTGKTTWIVQAGQNGEYVGKVLLQLDGNKSVKLDAYSLVPLTDEFEDDPEIAVLAVSGTP